MNPQILNPDTPLERLSASCRYCCSSDDIMRPTLAVGYTHYMTDSVLRPQSGYKGCRVGCTWCNIERCVRAGVPFTCHSVLVLTTYNALESRIMDSAVLASLQAMEPKLVVPAASFVSRYFPLMNCTKSD